MKKVAVAVAICLTVVMVATVAFAAAVKIDLDPFGAGADPMDGKVVLNFANKGDGKTEIQVNCSGLTPDQVYTAWVDDGGWIRVGEFVAGKNGKGHLHGRCPSDVSDCTRAAVNQGESTTILLGTP